jgi:hypothetical protein
MTPAAYHVPNGACASSCGACACCCRLGLCASCRRQAMPVLEGVGAPRPIRGPAGRRATVRRGRALCAAICRRSMPPPASITLAALVSENSLMAAARRAPSAWESTCAPSGFVYGPQCRSSLCPIIEVGDHTGRSGCSVCAHGRCSHWLRRCATAVRGVFLRGPYVRTGQGRRERDAGQRVRRAGKARLVCGFRSATESKRGFVFSCVSARSAAHRRRSR